MAKCAICSTEIKFINRPLLGYGKLNDGHEICTKCHDEIEMEDVRKFSSAEIKLIFLGEKSPDEIVKDRLRAEMGIEPITSAERTKKKVHAPSDSVPEIKPASNQPDIEINKKNRISKKMWALIVFGILVIIQIIVGGDGGSDYKGEYVDGMGKSITIKNKSILIMDRVNGVWESNSGKITSIAETDQAVSIKGETDYSGGSGSAFGVTIKPGQERHWTRPFMATINKKENTLHFEGVLIITSQDMRRWNVNLEKKK